MKKMDTKDAAISEGTGGGAHPRDNGGLGELAGDIREHGLINPITVMEQTEGGYVLIAGLRRLKAMELLGAKEIRATVMTARAGSGRDADAGDRGERTAQGIHGEREAGVCGEAEGGRGGEGAKAAADSGKASILWWPIGHHKTKHAETGTARTLLPRRRASTSTTQMRRAQAVSESRPDLMEQVDKGEKSISGAYSDMQRRRQGTKRRRRPKRQKRTMTCWLD